MLPFWMAAKAIGYEALFCWQCVRFIVLYKFVDTSEFVHVDEKVADLVTEDFVVLHTAVRRA